jgi:CRP-like cAMP-binding protein
MGWSHESMMDRLRPRLDFARFDRLRSYGSEHEVKAGDVLTRAGGFERDLVVLDEAHVEVVREASFDRSEEVYMSLGPGDFLGEVNLLSDQMAYVTVRVVAPGRIHRLSRTQFRTMMAEEVELSDTVLEALLVRREYLREVVRPVDIVGLSTSSATLSLRTYAARIRLPYRWHDADSATGRALLEAAGLTGDDLPAVLIGREAVRGGTRLDGHRRDRVGEHVVELVGDAEAFRGDARLRLEFLLRLEDPQALADLGAQLAAGSDRIAQQCHQHQRCGREQHEDGVLLVHEHPVGRPHGDEDPDDGEGPHTAALGGGGVDGDRKPRALRTAGVVEDEVEVGHRQDGDEDHCRPPTACDQHVLEELPGPPPGPAVRRG